MTNRMLIGKVSPAGYKATNALHEHVQANVEPRLHELIKTRASIINGCAYCIDMHTREAKSQGESEQRLYALAAWHESPFFDERERSALALTDAVTLISKKGVPEEVWDEAARHFSDEQLANLVLAIAQINTWNRIAIATGLQPKLREEPMAIFR